MIELNSKYFKLQEFTTSQIAAREGIDNTPPDWAIENLNWLCLKILDPLREKIGKPLYISSGFRCELLNKKAKGADNSQHTQGQAADIYVPGMTPMELFNYINTQTALPFDQLIEEFDSWVHISYDRNRQRHNKYFAKTVNGKVQYIVV